MSIKISVSTMTNCESFLAEGVTTAMKKLKNLGVDSLDISQHIQFNERTIPEFLACKKEMNIGVCALSACFCGTEPSPMPQMQHNGEVLRSYSAEEEFDLVVDLCKQLGCNYVRFAGFPGYRLVTEERVRSYMEALEALCVRFEAQGITFCAHNHADEFMRVGGKLLIEWAMELCPHLQFELDVLNAQKCGANPVEMLQKLQGCVPLLHVQDLAVVPGTGEEAWIHPEFRGVAVGSGNLNYRAICKAAEAAGAKYLILEQAHFYGEDVYDCIKSAIKALREDLA